MSLCCPLPNLAPPEGIVPKTLGPLGRRHGGAPRAKEVAGCLPTATASTDNTLSLLCLAAGWGLLHHQQLLGAGQGWLQLPSAPALLWAPLPLLPPCLTLEAGGSACKSFRMAEPWELPKSLLLPGSSPQTHLATAGLRVWGKLGVACTFSSGAGH